jgi:hypothetical protein
LLPRRTKLASKDINVNGNADGTREHRSVDRGKESKGATIDHLPSGANGPGERRITPRSSFTAEAVMIDLKSGTRIEAHTSDLSLGGCYVDTMNPFPAGTELQLRLTAEGKSFDAMARVAYCQIGVGMGLLFTSAGPDQLSTIKKWFSELSGETRPELRMSANAEQPLYRATAKNEEHYILEELLVLMMRKGLLTEEEGEPILRRLLR